MKPPSTPTVTLHRVCPQWFEYVETTPVDTHYYVCAAVNSAGESSFSSPAAICVDDKEDNIGIQLNRNGTEPVDHFIIYHFQKKSPDTVLMYTTINSGLPSDQAESAYFEILKRRTLNLVLEGENAGLIGAQWHPTFPGKTPALSFESPMPVAPWKYGYCTKCNAELSPAMDGHNATVCTKHSRNTP